MATQVILHADMDAFYASVEQRDHPELVGQPVIVGGLGSRGVVTAASYEARPFGVHSAMPIAEARRLCPHGVYLSEAQVRQVEVSKEIFTVFETFTPLVDRFPSTKRSSTSPPLGLFSTPVEVARQLKRRVREQCGLAVSVASHRPK